MSSVDSFIEALAQLLLACPSTTLLITYANRTKKSNKNPTKLVDGVSKAPLNVVKFKCFDPASGRVTKYSTSKVKELSRLLAFIGPRGVLVTSKSKIGAKLDPSSLTRHTAGLASIMTNVKFEETDVTPAVATLVSDTKELTPVPSNDASGASKAKKKKKKKKGKK